MLETYDWTDWFTELADKIAERDEAYLVWLRLRRKWSGATTIRCSRC